MEGSEGERWELCEGERWELCEVVVVLGLRRPEKGVRMPIMLEGELLMDPVMEFRSSQELRGSICMMGREVML